MEEFKNILRRINETYQNNIEESKESLLNIGINTMYDDGHYKDFSKVIDELSSKWDELSKPQNNVIKELICRKLVGLRDKNFLIALIDNMQK